MTYQYCKSTHFVAFFTEEVENTIKRGNDSMLNISNKTILLADNDADYMKMTKEGLEKNISVKVVDMASNGEEALQKAEQKRPDIILMDILLGEKNGLWLLEELNKKGINSNCIILSAIEKGNVMKRAMSLGATNYIIKPTENNILLEKMVQVLTAPEEMSCIKQKAVLSQMETDRNDYNKKQNKYELESTISKLLNRMGITASIKGYHFIIKGVMMVIENREAILSITKGLYPDIAKEYNTTAGKVERAMRHAIETAWKRTGKEIFYEMAGYYPMVKPTNSQFIATMSEYLRCE